MALKSAQNARNLMIGKHTLNALMLTLKCFSVKQMMFLQLNQR
jgi:seryl-tRNA(Sec) selenium transferase